MTDNNVAVFTAKVLPASETFIPAPYVFAKRYSAHFFGCRRVDGLAVPGPPPVTVASDGRLSRIADVAFKVTGRSKRLRRGLQRVDPSLVHAHFGHSGAMILPMVERLRIPLIVTFHGYDATASERALRTESIQGFVYTRRRRALFENATQVVAVSHFIRDRVIEQGAPPEKTVVHYTGIDTQRFHPDPTRTDNRLVLFVGRLVEKKGVRDLVRAMAIVQRQLPGARLVVLGDGPLRQELQQLARGIVRHVSFEGFVTPERVGWWLSRAAVLAFPSKTAPNGDAEGLGMVALEAQAMGVPVVGTLHGGIPEAVAHEETGLLSAEGDVTALAHGIERLLGDEDGRQRMGRAGRKRVDRLFDLRTQAAQLERLYDGVCA